MKILHATHNYFPSVGGAQLVVHHLANTQREHGHDAHVMIPRKRKKKFTAQSTYPLLEFAPGFSHASRYSDNFISNFWFQIVTSNLQSRENFDVWHLHETYPEGQFIPALKKRKIPAIVTIHSPYFGDAEDQLQFKKDILLVNNILQHVDICCVLCQRDADKLKNLGMPNSKIRIVDNGVNISAFKSVPDKTIVRKRYGIPEDVPLLISSGRYAPQKGFDLIPAVLRRLKETYGHVHWCVLGRDTHLLQHQADVAGVGDMLTALGEFSPILSDNSIEHPQKNYAEILCCSDIYISLSRHETFSLVLFEAMAAGLPLVYTDIARSDDLDKWNVGKKINVNDIDGAANAISEILSNKKTSSLFSLNGRSIIKKYFSWDSIARSYESLYKEII